MPDSIITCENVTIGYGLDIILQNINLAIAPGTFLPVVGPNGAGKSTLLRTIAGFIKPIQGHIKTPFAHQPLGYVPQFKNIDPLYPVSVRQIVSMGLYRRLGPWRRVRGEAAKALQEALEQFNLADHAHKTFAELSGGMKQKALLARAFVTGADVLIMDEPTAELDAAAEHMVLDHLHRLSREHGKTVLLAHHGLNHMNQLADELCLVNRGQVSLIKSKDAQTTAQAVFGQQDN